MARFLQIYGNNLIILFTQVCCLYTDSICETKNNGVKKMENPTTMKRHIPENVYNAIVEYFQDDLWFFIKHPDLGYVCPLEWIRQGKSINVVKYLALRETSY